MKHSFLATLLTSILTQFSPAAEVLASKPNILFFLVDDMGWQETSVPFHTEPTKLNKIYQTPAMVSWLVKESYSPTPTPVPFVRQLVSV